MTADRFTRVFRMNVERRSRTAKGKDEGSKTSTTKRPLLLQGDELKAKVAENVGVLIEDVWAKAQVLRDDHEKRVRPSDLRAMCERWYDIACDGLIDSAGYEPEFAKLDESYRKLGESVTLNRRYRIWTPKYLVLQIPPAAIDRELAERLYSTLAFDLNVLYPRTKDVATGDLTHLLAVADVWMDGEIHPWLDGCSRVSTALVMWLAAVYGNDYPLFAPTKDEHYASIRDLDAHGDYFAECLVRADAEAP